MRRHPLRIRSRKSKAMDLIQVRQTKESNNLQRWDLLVLARDAKESIGYLNAPVTVLKLNSNATIVSNRAILRGTALISNLLYHKGTTVNSKGQEETKDLKLEEVKLFQDNNQSGSMLSSFRMKDL